MDVKHVKVTGYKRKRVTKGRAQRARMFSKKKRTRGANLDNIEIPPGAVDAYYFWADRFLRFPEREFKKHPSWQPQFAKERGWIGDLQEAGLTRRVWILPANAATAKAALAEYKRRVIEANRDYKEMKDAASAQLVVNPSFFGAAEPDQPEPVEPEGQRGFYWPGGGPPSDDESDDDEIDAVRRALLGQKLKKHIPLAALRRLGYRAGVKRMAADTPDKIRRLIKRRILEPLLVYTLAFTDSRFNPARAEPDPGNKHTILIDDVKRAIARFGEESSTYRVYGVYS